MYIALLIFFGGDRWSEGARRAVSGGVWVCGYVGRMWAYGCVWGVWVYRCVDPLV